MTKHAPYDRRFATLLSVTFGLMLTAVTAMGVSDGIQSGRQYEVAYFLAIPFVYVVGLFWVFKKH